MTHTFEAKFNIGDTVYLVTKSYKRIKCDYCEGHGSFSIKDKTLQCPKCYGRGTKQSNEKVYMIHETPYTITDIRARIINESNKIELSYKITNKNNKTHFTPYTSIVTMRLSEQEIYATKEEAQDACDKLNTAMLCCVSSDAYTISITDNNDSDAEIIYGEDKNVIIKAYINGIEDGSVSFGCKLIGATDIAEIRQINKNIITFFALNNCKNVGKIFYLKVWNDELGIEYKKMFTVVGFFG